MNFQSCLGKGSGAGVRDGSEHFSHRLRMRKTDNEDRSEFQANVTSPVTDGTLFRGARRHLFGVMRGQA